MPVPVEGAVLKERVVPDTLYLFVSWITPSTETSISSSAPTVRDKVKDVVELLFESEKINKKKIYQICLDIKKNEKNI